MKKIVTLLFLIGMTQYGNTQFLKDLKKEVIKSAKEAATKKTKKETEKKVDKTLDKVLNPKLSKKNKTDQEKIDSAFSQIDTASINQPGKYFPSYTFEMKAYTQVISYKRRKSDTNRMEFSYGKTASGTSVADKKILMITDWKNESTIMLDDNQKTARVISLGFLSQLKLPESEEKPDETENDVTYKKTGLTKQIAGYTSHQYIITTKDAKVELWFAPAVKYSSVSNATKFAQIVDKEIKDFPDDKGYLMEMINYEKGKKKSHLLVTKIETKPYTIKISDYAIQK